MLTRNEIKLQMTQPWTYYFTRGLVGEESQIVLKSQKSVNMGTQYGSVVTTGGSCRNECGIHVKNPKIVQMHEFIEPTEKELDEYEVVYKEGLKSIANGDIYAFNDRGNPEEVLLSKPAFLHAKRFALDKAEKETLIERLYNNSYSKIGIPSHGVMFSFLDMLTLFVVKTDYDLLEYYAPDKKSLVKYLKDRGEKVLYAISTQGEAQ